MTGRTRTQKHIGAKLEALMESRNMEVGEVSYLLFVSQATVYRWLADETVPHPVHLKAVAELFNVEVRDLYDSKEAA